MSAENINTLFDTERNDSLPLHKLEIFFNSMNTLKNTLISTQGAYFDPSKTKPSTKFMNTLLINIENHLEELKEKAVEGKDLTKLSTSRLAIFLHMAIAYNYTQGNKTTSTKALSASDFSRRYLYPYKVLENGVTHGKDFINCVSDFCKRLNEAFSKIGGFTPRSIDESGNIVEGTKGFIEQNRRDNEISNVKQ